MNAVREIHLVLKYEYAQEDISTLYLAKGMVIIKNKSGISRSFCYSTL